MPASESQDRAIRAARELAFVARGTASRGAPAIVAAALRNALTPIVAYFDTLDMVPIDDIREGIERIKAIADALGGPVVKGDRDDR